MTLEGNKQLAKYVDLTLPQLKVLLLLFLSFLLLVVFVMPCHAMRLQAIVVWGEAADPALVAKSKVRLFALPSP